MGFLAYQLLYVQLPLILFPFPKQDFREFLWIEEATSIGMYYYTDPLIAQFENQKYMNRSVLGEGDFFVLSEREEYDTIPYSYLRTVSGDYRLLHLHFDRKLDWGTCSGGILGLRDIGQVLKGYGSLTFPFILNGNISTSIYENIINFSVNCDYLYFETTRDKWFGYFKFWDGRLGVTHDDKEFASYLFRLRDPIFLVMANVVGEGLFTEGRFEIEDYFIAPIYVLSLDNSIYCVISKDVDSSVVGIKSRYAGLEVGKESFLLAVNSDLLKAFIDYSYDDFSFRGAVAGELEYSFYKNRITPGVRATLYDNEEFDFELSLRILEVKFFWGMKKVTFEGYYEKNYWGMQAFFSF